MDQLQADAAIIAKNFSSMLDANAMRISKHTLLYFLYIVLI